MYYRRKVILALLQQFGGKLNPTVSQKLLLIFTRQQQKPAYEFVPYKYGAYSFQARADKGTMVKYELLKKSKHWVINTDEDYIGQLKEKDQEILKDLHVHFKDHTREDLIRYTYRVYPYYAIRSTVARTYVEEGDLKRIDLFRPVNNEQMLYTIGYEGIKAEEYMNRLLKKDIRLLVDVRRNSVSMKYGFSKSQLKGMCKKLGIKFIHIPELGIESGKRKNLDSREDYAKLFEEYESETLPTQADHLERLYNLYRQHERVATTCFEKEHTLCHRHKVSEYLQKEYGVPVEHL